MPRGNRDEALPHNWDPMQEEYDGNASDLLQFDRLYVTNIPQKLDEGGVENIFKPYGQLKKTFLNTEPQKRYAMVTFVDTRDAERALHGLHMKAPLKLNVEFSKTKEWHNQREKDRGSGKQRNSKQNTVRNSAVDDGKRQELTDRGSVSSSGRRSNVVGHGRQDWVHNNEDFGDYYSDEENYGLDDLELASDEVLDLNPGARVHRLLEQLAEAKVELVRSQMREEAAQLGLNGVAGRKSLPANLSKSCFMTANGRIVRQVSAVPNSGLPRRDLSERHEDIDDDEDGDLEQVPELRAHICVYCGHRGELECGTCGTTYCSLICQRKDWMKRHSSVCHNLANSTANLARASGFQQGRQPRKQTVASPEIPEKTNSNSNQDGQKRQAPKRFTNSNMQGNGQHNEDGNTKSRQFHQNKQNRHGDNSGNASWKNRQQQNSNADFCSGGNNKPSDSNKMNPVPIRRPNWKSPQNNEDWDVDEGKRQLDAPESNDARARDVAGVSSMPIKTLRTVKPKEVAKETAQPVKKAKKNDKLRPDGFVALHASPGTILTLSVEADGATCEVDASCGQAVCVVVTEEFAPQFAALCGDEFAEACEKSEVCSPTPGTYVAMCDMLDGGWYRARILMEKRAALVDAARIANVNCDDASAVRRLPENFIRAPEFCCVVKADSGVDLKVGESYECIVGDVSSKGECSGTLRKLMDAGGKSLGSVTLRRWRCKTEEDLAKAEPAKTTATATGVKKIVKEAKVNVVQPKGTLTPAASIDAILGRPAVVHESKVLLVEYVDSSRVFVRRADEDLKLEFDSLVQDVAVYGLDAPPLTEPQPVGGVVIAQFTDGNYYRAIITKRSRVEQNKYMLEYIEYGNTEISTLDKLRECPDELSLETRPALLSRVSLADVTSDDDGKTMKFTEECTRYMGELKDKELELVLTLKETSSKGVVGCEVTLRVDQTKERVNEKLRRMLMPEWEVMESKGEDVIESPVLMWSDMKIAPLPKRSCRLQVLDTATLVAGAFSACSADEDWGHKVMELSEELEKYVGSKVGSAPYLPRPNELCVAKSGDGKWYRAACVEHPGGAGASLITILHIDSGCVDSVAVSDVRKMLPEMAKRTPAMAVYCAIDGYPKDPSDELIARTRELLGVTETSVTGDVVDCSEANQTSEGEYSIVLPTVMATLKAEGLFEQ